MKKGIFFLIFTVLFAAAILALGVRHYLLLRKAADQIVSNQKRQDIAITITEGKRKEEIAAQLASAGICSYQDFLVASANFEGTLFPDTYRFFPNSAATDVVSKMEADFVSRTSADAPTHDQLVLASIVEREAENDHDRPLIAAVYANRLSIGMSLQSDPTVQYSKDSIDYQNSKNPESFKFWNPITQEDYHSASSPFNTYEIAALPPEPIANPGLASIEAAIHPANNNYLYFIYRNKQLILSKTWPIL